MHPTGVEAGDTLAVNLPALTPDLALDRRVTLVHDYLLVMRGAERTFAAIADLYDDAPVFTLLYDEAGVGARFSGREIHTSPLQRFGVGQRGFRRLLPLYPWAVGQLELPRSDVVLSSSSAFAHGVRVPPEAVHVCYCHAPFRYAWNEQARALEEVPRAVRPLLRRRLQAIRRWDLSASRRVDSYLANSQLTRERIKRFYDRESTVVHPPVETERFAPGVAGEALLVVTELVPHKRVDIALEAARRAHASIQVVGTGPDYARLKAAFPEARFLGRVTDDELAGLYSSARAVLATTVEEFGITAVEAQAAGRPVIAAGAGGALETVLEGRTGLFAPAGDVGGFARSIEALDELAFVSAEAVQNAARFSVANFRRRIAEQIDLASQQRAVTL